VKGRDHSGGQGIGRGMWTGFIWLRIHGSGYIGLAWKTHFSIAELHKRKGIS